MSLIKYDKAAAKSTEASYSTADIAHQRLKIIESLGLQAGEKVLDVGCGPGFLAKEMASLVGEQGQVQGIDNSEDMLAIGKTRCAEIAQIKLALGSAAKLPVLDNHFDAATCIQTLLYVDDVSKALNELARTLKSGGRLAVVETDWRSLLLNSNDHALTQRILSAFDQAVPNADLPSCLPALLKQHGFHATHVQAIPIINQHNSSGYFAHDIPAWHARLAHKLGIISDNEMKAWLADLDHKAANGEFFFSINRYLFNAVWV